jgi:hypothetical protein
MAEIWGAAIAGIAVAGASVYNANQNRPEAPEARNLGGELGGINASYEEVLSNYLAGSPYATANSMDNLTSLVGGSFDMERFLAAHPDARADWDAHWTNGELTNWTPAQYATAYLGGPGISINSNGGALLREFQSGGIPDISADLNTRTRTANLQDVQNLGGQYTDLTRGANQDYYNALNSYTTATQQPVAQSAPQSQAAQLAGQGFGTFDPSGLQANTNFSSQTITPGSVAAPNTMLGVNTSQGSPLLDRLNQQALTQGPSGLQTQQNALATRLMNEGGNLSASDLRNVQQSSRAGFAARGLDATNASVVDETMSTDAARRARLIQNLGIAQSVQNQGMNELGQQQQFGLGVSGQNFGYEQLGLQGQVANQNAYQNLNALNLQAQLANQNAGLAAQQSNQSANLQAQNMGLQGQLANQNFGLNSFTSNLNSQTAQQQALNHSAALLEEQRQAQLNSQGQAVQLQRQGYLDPFAAIIGSADQNLLNQLLGTNNANQATQSNLYAGLLGYGGDLNNTNYNANAAANIAGYNGQQAMYGSLLHAGGNLAGAYLGSRGTGSSGTSNTNSNIYGELLF